MSYEYYITPEEYAIAELNGISRSTLEYRIKNLAWKKEEALNKPPRRQCAEKKKWQIVGEENGITRFTFHQRILRGWDMEDAATTPTLSQKETLKRMNEKQHRIFTDEQLKRARSLGISNKRLHARTVTLGWSKERAISTPIMSNEESIKRAQAASPFREMNEIYWNMKKRPTAIQHRRDGNVHENQI